MAWRLVESDRAQPREGSETLSYFLEAPPGKQACTFFAKATPKHETTHSAISTDNK